LRKYCEVDFSKLQGGLKSRANLNPQRRHAGITKKAKRKLSKLARLQSWRRRNLVKYDERVAYLEKEIAELERQVQL
jgi:flagellar motility protein MotE (MotC chaperone)